ncbi:hypothetical protein TRFO_22594 [Tritrichomonas foetus]|uniref:Uncharacterized protein n=1 Tax=Tritrichomonas foetus TaxID=1144522 RepID=A0A1J4KD19_9EUKA|nr:hypothetical protein TRFO_22594 [Tritrichomonas foetus]|eukprot:OHT08832.1 hypothetical protein TRFO_22594 [Tritrichomonas foetus]
MKFILFYYPFNIFWIATICPLISLSIQYSSSLFLNGLCSQMIPIIPHLFSEHFNMKVAILFDLLGGVSIVLITKEILGFLSKIPDEKASKNIQIYRIILLIGGPVISITLLMIHFLDLNQSAIFTFLNLLFFYVSASLFHYVADKIPRRYHLMSDISSTVTYLLIAFSAISMTLFFLCCFSHKIDVFYTISALAQYLAFLLVFVKFIFSAISLYGPQFLSIFVHNIPTKRSPKYSRISA